MDRKDGMKTGLYYNKEEEEKNEQEKKEDVKKESRDFLSRLTDSYEVPPKIRKRFWGIFNKNIVLSKLSNKDIDRAMRMFDDMVNEYYISQPEHGPSFEDSFNHKQMRADLYFMLKRAKDGFERTMQKTGKQVQKLVIEEKNVEQGGITSKLGGLVGKSENEQKEMMR